MSKQDQGLEAIKARMTEQQRRDMAEVIRKEMERRALEKRSAPRKSGVSTSSLSGPLSSDGVRELYQDVGQTIQQLRLKKLEEKVEAARRGQQEGDKLPRTKTPRGEGESSGAGGKILFLSVLALGAAKVVLSLDLIPGAVPGVQPQVAEASISSLPAEQTTPEFKTPWTRSEKELLTQLDSRRVELEKRKDVLDQREADIQNQGKALAERLAELRALTNKLAEARKERDRHQQSRLEQLANVYGAMEPTEAAQLISRLEDSISLELLERLPEKRMGQILGFMDKERAVALTKMLTDKKSL